MDRRVAVAANRCIGRRGLQAATFAVARRGTFATGRSHSQHQVCALILTLTLLVVVSNASINQSKIRIESRG